MFDLIRENNLFTDVQDQVLLLVEFDHELMEKRKQEGWIGTEVKSDAINLLVNNIHSIPVSFVFLFYVEPYLAHFFPPETIDYTGGATASGTIILSFPLPGCPCAYRFSSCIWLCRFAGTNFFFHNQSIPFLIIILLNRSKCMQNSRHLD